mgnify:CR=1 FL=1
MAGSSLGANGAAAAQPYYSSAAGMSGLGAAQPYFGAGTSMIGASVNPLGYNAASPYLGQAAGTVENVDSYMNPYIDRVVDRIGELGQRNLLDNIMRIAGGFAIRYGEIQDDPIMAEAPDFKLQGVSHEAFEFHALTDYRGKWVVLEWLNPGCPYVQKHYDSRNMQGLQKEFGKQRCFDAPISEGGIVGTAVGMAAIISKTRTRSSR